MHTVHHRPHAQLKFWENMQNLRSELATCRCRPYSHPALIYSHFLTLDFTETSAGVMMYLS